MKIVVIGGTGLIGSKAVAILRQGGHDVVTASPNTGVNTITGEGLERRPPAQVVVDVANSPSFEDKAVLESPRNGIVEIATRMKSSVTPRPDTSAAGSRSIRSCRWAKRASAASIWRNGSAPRPGV